MASSLLSSFGYIRELIVVNVSSIVLAFSGSTVYILGLLVVGAWVLSSQIVVGCLRYSRLSYVPGPRAAGFSGFYLTYFDLCVRRREKLQQWHARYGSVIRIGPNEVSLANPVDFHEIYGTKTRYDKTAHFKSFALNGEDNIFSTQNHLDHQAKKKKFAFAYSKSNLIPRVENLVQERVDCLIKEVSQAENGLIDAFVLLNCFTHDVISRFLYGKNHGSDAISNTWERHLVSDLSQSQAWTPLWVNLGWAHDNWLVKHVLGREYSRMCEVDTAVQRLNWRKMAEHDANPNRDDELSIYRTLRYANADGSTLSQCSIAAEMYDQVQAGQHDTATVLTYIMWRLSCHLEWQERVKAEVRALGASPGEEVALADVESCKIVNAVILETLRLHTADAGRNERRVPSGGRHYSGIFLPEGTSVIAPTFLLHQNEEAFPEPQAWNPGRWLDADAKQHIIMLLSFAPFGSGPRQCIAKHLATMEMKLLVAKFYRNFSTVPKDHSGCHMSRVGASNSVIKGQKCELYAMEK